MIAADSFNVDTVSMGPKGVILGGLVVRQMKFHDIFSFIFRKNLEFSISPLWGARGSERLLFADSFQL